MGDYISKQSAIEGFYEMSSNTDYLCTVEDYVHFLESLSSADVVKVGRCKYCKHSTEWYKDKRRCFLWCENGVDVFEDGYCSYWETKK